MLLSQTLRSTLHKTRNDLEKEVCCCYVFVVGLCFVFLCDTYVRGYIYGTSTVQCIMNIGETSRKKSFLGGKNRKKSFFGGEKLY